jgi:hypothetical protein
LLNCAVSLKSIIYCESSDAYPLGYDKTIGKQLIQSKVGVQWNGGLEESMWKLTIRSALLDHKTGKLTDTTEREMLISTTASSFYTFSLYVKQHQRVKNYYGSIKEFLSPFHVYFAQRDVYLRTPTTVDEYCMSP